MDTNWTITYVLMLGKGVIIQDLKMESVLNVRKSISMLDTNAYPKMCQFPDVISTTLKENVKFVKMAIIFLIISVYYHSKYKPILLLRMLVLLILLDLLIKALLRVGMSNQSPYITKIYSRTIFNSRLWTSSLLSTARCLIWKLGYVWSVCMGIILLVIPAIWFLPYAMVIISKLDNVLIVTVPFFS